MKRRKI